MFDREATLYAFTLAYLQRLMGDLDDSQLDTTHHPGGHSARWILGHLAICTDYAAHILGQEKACPDSWHQAFGPGSKADGCPTPKPSKAELMRAIEEGHARVTAALPSAQPERLAKPHKLEILFGTPIKTVGDLLAHLLSTHEAAHIGQLSVWRRQIGRPVLF